MSRAVGLALAAALLAAITGCGGDAPTTNSLGMAFVDVPGTGLRACVHETRVVDFRAFTDATDYPAFTTPGRADNHPVTGLGTADANAFCLWLTAVEIEAGLIDINQRYRLPTSAEWGRLLAAAQREPGAYPWGDQWPPPAGYGNYLDGDEVRWGRTPIPDFDDGHADSAPVMSYAPDRLGLHDLSGNVWEMCVESRVPDVVHCLRGGSYVDAEPRVLRGDFSFEIEQGNNHPLEASGFRVVLVLDDGFTPLMQACLDGALGTVAELLAAGANVDAQNEDGMTALMYSILAGHPAVARALLAQGADVHPVNVLGAGVLYLAVEQGDRDLVERIIARGARVDRRCNDGSSPLYAAVGTGRPDLVDRLLAAGATVDLPTQDGTTPLMLAAYMGDGEVVGKLLAAGADPRRENERGVSALGAAEAAGHEDVVGLLRGGGG